MQWGFVCDNVLDSVRVSLCTEVTDIQVLQDTLGKQPEGRLTPLPPCRLPSKATVEHSRAKKSKIVQAVVFSTVFFQAAAAKITKIVHWYY